MEYRSHLRWWGTRRRIRRLGPRGVRDPRPLLVRNEVPYLAVLVTYGSQPRSAEPAPADKARSRDASWRALVSDEDLPLFNALRDWRAERAQRDGVPPYLICTNRQLAEMVSGRPQSMSKLGAIDGIGKAKLENYGQDLLALLARPQTEGESPGQAAVNSPGRLAPVQQSPTPALEGALDG